MCDYSNSVFLKSFWWFYLLNVLLKSFNTEKLQEKSGLSMPFFDVSPSLGVSNTPTDDLCVNTQEFHKMLERKVRHCKVTQGSF